ncbi:MAG: energy-coupling factor transporter transmembrane protein EcfT [Clostridiales bacterium]|nr:energy-coupling factor transporter transmembrane protein EcfT [Clostridia bacterium]MCR4564219.1 energy-coupling factor transporter transmembrane protein EcfT [Clostridiales bacterium]
MIKEITIGQYFPGNSLVHRLDARIKLILTFVFIVAIFICKNFLSLGLVALVLLFGILVSRISITTILKGLKAIILIIIVTSLLQVFYNKQGDMLFEWRFIHITSKGLMLAGFTSLRIIILVITGSMLTYTTSPTILTDAIERLFSPLNKIKVDVHVLAMMMTIALRFIPILIEEIDKIMSAQKARGAVFDEGGLIKRSKALMTVVVPLFVNSFRRAYELSFSMECRCYRGGEGRTRLREMKIGILDVFAIIFMAALISSIILLNIYFVSVI